MRQHKQQSMPPPTTSDMTWPNPPQALPCHSYPSIYYFIIASLSAVTHFLLLAPYHTLALLNPSRPLFKMCGLFYSKVTAQALFFHTFTHLLPCPWDLYFCKPHNGFINAGRMVKAQTVKGWCYERHPAIALPKWTLEYDAVLGPIGSPRTVLSTIYDSMKHRH